MRNTLQEQYNLIKEGKGNKQQFFKSVRQLFPNLVTPVNTYEDTVRILKNRGIITESIGGVVTKGKTPDWHQIFKDNIAEAKEAKAEEKETTKEVTDMATRGYDYKDTKNYDNVFGQEFLKGFYTEMQEGKNKDKGVDELKAIVAKNLAKDINHYVKDGQFGIKGVGYTVDAPGLGESKPAKGKHKSSGYGDLKESVLRSQIYLLVKEVLAEGENKDLSKHRLGVLKAALAHAEKEIKTVDKDSKAYKEFEKTIAGKKAEIKALEKEVLDESLTPADEMAFSQAVDFAEDLYDKVGNVEDVLANLPQQFIQYKDELEQHLTQKYEGVDEAKKPSSGLTKKEKSTISKKAHAGGDIGKKGKGFEKVAKAAEKQYGSKEAGEKVAAAAMWKSQAAKKG